MKTLFYDINNLQSLCKFFIIEKLQRKMVDVRKIKINNIDKSIHYANNARVHSKNQFNKRRNSLIEFDVADLKTIYTAVNQETVLGNLINVKETWKSEYPNAIKVLNSKLSHI